MLKRIKLTSVLIVSVILILIFLTFFSINKKNNTQQISTKLITSVQKDLPLKFNAERKNITLKPGEIKTINYSVENLGKKSVSAMATFQVYPPELKEFMTKMNCFCYEKQTLKA